MNEPNRDTGLPPRTVRPLRLLAALVLILAGAGLALAFVLRGVVDTARRAVTPDVVEAPTLLLVTLDSAAAERVSGPARELDTTPALRALVEAGGARSEVRLRSSGTNGALATLMTGLPPELHDVRSLRRRGRAALPVSCTTLAERLREQGWATFAAVSLPQLDARLAGFARGFDTYLEAQPDTETGVEPSERFVARVHSSLAEVLAEERPVFAWLHLADPRVLGSTGGEAPSGAGDRYAAGFLNHHLAPLRGRSTVVDRALDLEPRAGLLELRDKLARRRGSAEQVAFLEALYDGQLRAMDDGLRELVSLTEARRAAPIVAVVGVRGHLPPGVERPRGAVGAELGREPAGQSVEMRPSVGLRTPVVVRGAGPAGALPAGDLDLGDVHAALALATAAAPRADFELPVSSLEEGWFLRVEVGERAPGDVSVRIQSHADDQAEAESMRLAPGEAWTFERDDPVAVEFVLRRSADDVAFLDEASISWAGEPLTSVPLLRVAAERGDPWPEDAGEPLVDVVPEQGRWLRVTVVGREAGQAARVLVALAPPAELPEAPLVRDERGVSSSGPLACREVWELRGTTPFSFAVQKFTTRSLGLAVELEGVFLPGRELRYRGRRFTRGGETRLYVPAWLPGAMPTPGEDGTPRPPEEDPGLDRGSLDSPSSSGPGGSSGSSGAGEVRIRPW